MSKKAPKVIWFWNCDSNAFPSEIRFCLVWIVYGITNDYYTVKWCRFHVHFRSVWRYPWLHINFNAFLKFKNEFNTVNPKVLFTRNIKKIKGPVAETLMLTQVWVRFYCTCAEVVAPGVAHYNGRKPSEQNQPVSRHVVTKGGVSPKN